MEIQACLCKQRSNGLFPPIPPKIKTDFSLVICLCESPQMSTMYELLQYSFNE